ncbi:Protein of unknown function [Pseudidiomarina indica]|uniref:Uncharacterized protein n=1 Tax=Pseudidiomarina indica TaxID=1159017 RepID=A0A1G6CY93_9GAMM|nr:Protein of unknown function [Pseudidiomarina indica]
MKLSMIDAVEMLRSEFAGQECNVRISDYGTRLSFSVYDEQTQTQVWVTDLNEDQVTSVRRFKFIIESVRSTITNTIH